MYVLFPQIFAAAMCAHTAELLYSRTHECRSPIYARVRSSVAVTDFSCTMHALSLPAAPIPFSLSFLYLVLPSVPHPPLSSFFIALYYSLFSTISLSSIFPPLPLLHPFYLPALSILLLPNTHSLPCPVFCFLPFPFPLPCSPFFSTDPPLPLSVSSPPLPSRFLPFLPRGGLSMACCRFCSSSALPAVSSYSAMLCWSGTSYSSMSVCVCVCLSVVVVLSKRVNKSRWFWHAFFHASYTLL